MLFDDGNEPDELEEDEDLNEEADGGGRGR